MSHPRATPQRVRIEALPSVHLNAAGLDIGSEEIVAAVPPDRTCESVRAFATCTPDLQALVEWLVACGVATGAMESTSGDWVPIYALLEHRGSTPYLVNAQPGTRWVKTVPGRKTDWHDAHWLQRLHTLGLLQGSFRPDAAICTLRTLVRHRAALIQHRAPHSLHLQQALKQMNIQLNVVLTDITGTIGQAIVRAIVDGARDPVQLAQFRNPNGQSTEAELATALPGTWHDAHLFVLKQARALFDYYTAQIAACDAEIARTYLAMEARAEPEPPFPPLPPAKPQSKSKNKPNFNVRAQVAGMLGVDLVAVTGLSASTVQPIISEIGTDMTRFPTVKHCCSWLGLAPRNAILGGKVLRSRTLKVVNRAGYPLGVAFRQAAQSVARSDSAFGASFRAMRARLGPGYPVGAAIVATAHTLARVVYQLLQTREPVRADSAAEYEQHRRERELQRLMRQAQKLGFSLTPVSEPGLIPPSQGAAAVVSQ